MHLRDVQQAFYGLCVNAGKQVLAAMMEADRVAPCGAKNVPDAGRKAMRGGTTRFSVVLGGQHIAVTKPWARSLQHGELELATFAWGGGHRPARHGHAGLAGRRGVHAALRRPRINEVSFGARPRRVSHVGSALRYALRILGSHSG